MKRILFLAAFSSLGLISLAQNPKVINDAMAQTRDVKGFHAIKVSGGIDLYLSQGAEAVAVSASSTDYRDRIKTVVENGVLEIYLDHNWSHWGWGNAKLKAYVSFSTLQALEASGGSDIYTNGTVKVSNLDVHLSGGSDFKGTVDIGELSIKQSGGSDVNISGTVKSLDVHASGGSDLNGYDLVTENCRITASGGSDAHITVTRELSADASGGSDIYYKGSAVIRQLNSSGSSSVTHKG
ncbi:MAG TPA: head GIN domain-containing protein [Puia sp.]|nr:head GIN domain-containing protein [Puia sp.]